MGSQRSEDAAPPSRRSCSARRSPRPCRHWRRPRRRTNPSPGRSRRSDPCFRSRNPPRCSCRTSRWFRPMGWARMECHVREMEESDGRFSKHSVCGVIAESPSRRGESLGTGGAASRWHAPPVSRSKTMFLSSEPRRIFAYSEAVDTRKSFNGLVALVQGVLAEDPLPGSLFAEIILCASCPFHSKLAGHAQSCSCSAKNRLSRVRASLNTLV